MKLDRAKLIRQIVEEVKAALNGDKPTAAKVMDRTLPGWTIVAEVEPELEVVDPEVLEASEDDAPETSERELMEAANAHGMDPDRAEGPSKADRIRQCLCALKRAMVSK